VEDINNARADTIQLGGRGGGRRGRVSCAIQKPAATGRARPGTSCTGDVEGTIEVRRTDTPRRGVVAACSGDRRPSPPPCRRPATTDGREERGPLSGFRTCTCICRFSSTPSCRAALVKETVVEEEEDDDDEEKEVVPFSAASKVRGRDDDDDDDDDDDAAADAGDGDGDGDGEGGGLITGTAVGTTTAVLLPAAPTASTVVV
jgi:hypothetical protein